MIEKEDILSCIEEREKDVLEMLEVDKKIDADPYDDVARMKELQKVKKCILKKIKEKE